MDKTLHMTMLFDFFGELLTKKQREYFDLYYNENLSLSEIAENEGISRQGVRDIIVRAESILLNTESKTGIVKRYTEMQGDIAVIEGYIREISVLNQSRFKNGRLQELSNNIYERLQLLKS
ncbi:MAG: YlxM family DNA-binding protein [Clostridiales bacterium]|nr:YlxM family DNA-binding protein [Clostridiales bacterium]